MSGPVYRPDNWIVRSKRDNCREQAVTLKFRLLSIHFTFELFESGRKMSVIGDVAPIHANNKVGTSAENMAASEV
jgi:hypothetical protein